MQEAMARQAPTYASHINQIRQQAQQETAQEQGRLRSQLARMQAEMQQLQACCDADRQATKDLMEVEKIQVHLCWGHKQGKYSYAPCYAEVPCYNMLHVKF